ncbi:MULTISPECIES: GNAT family N-acetyltransferase [Pseudomonas]|uniref:GNAT family N-acetyltransferase n=1 Tax=Pseudomonas quercus TaxID=2722792 RepID=A0ABX0YJ31_9PSED|nr:MULTISPECIES: GNAT family N-acetyltransferase [Pseudomonas]MBF7144775.1 GNAT family N-acetyltransferase [Pseudomonas sp. LY10J]NJP03312.1 GNAT family N-acetyltransferase [Pseudomonas quercus]
MSQGRPFTVRDAVASDALCIAALGLQVFLDTYATEGIRTALAQEALEAFSLENVASLLGTPGVMLLVADYKGHMVGFAQLALNTAHDLIACPHACELQRLYVQERFTGKGVGARLLTQAERRAHAEGASSLWATVWVENQRALAFYPRQGYEHRGSPSYTFQGETHGNVLFAKRLLV